MSSVGAWGRSVAGTRSYGNQDTFAFHAGEDAAMAAVFDGHGEHGGIVSRFVRDHMGALLEGMLVEPRGDAEEIAARLRGIAAESHEAAVRELGDFTTDSGTTVAACVAYRTTGGPKDDSPRWTLHVANCGDSRVRVVSFPSGDTGARAIAWQSEVHSVSNPVEVERLRAVGRVTYLGRLGGVLAMTRAFGDTDLEGSGLSHDVDISTYELPPNSESVVSVLTDGAWETHDLATHARYVERVRGRVVAKIGAVDTGCAKVFAGCMARRESVRTRTGRDDSTAAVLVFAKPPPGAASAPEP